METFLYIFAKTVSIILSLVIFGMMVRMLLPIFFEAEGNPIYAFSCVITEPFIAPIRALLFAFNIGQGSPIDWSFFLTYLILSVLRSSFPVI